MPEVTEGAALEWLCGLELEVVGVNKSLLEPPEDWLEMLGPKAVLWGEPVDIFRCKALTYTYWRLCARSYEVSSNVTGCCARRCRTSSESASCRSRR